MSTSEVKSSMKRKPSTYVILNPASAGGETAKRQNRIVNAIEQHFGSDYSLFVTQKAFEACGAAKKALLNGCELILAVGGDGTLQEVVNGFFANGHLVNPRCQLGFISSGTGQGFAQSVGLPQSSEDQIELIRNSNSRMVDVGRVSFTNANGERSRRYFINECQLGIGGEVVKRVRQDHKMLGGTLAFGLMSIKTVFQHRNQQMRIVLGGDRRISGNFTGIVVANGAYTGGGMNLAPRARVDDSLLDVVVMHDLTISQRLRTFSKIYSGRHIELPYLSYHQVRSLTIDSDQSVSVEADGELLGTTPCTIEILPSILSVRCLKKEKK